MSLDVQTPTGDFRPETLQAMQDCIYLNVFDEFFIDLVQDSREKGRQIHQRRERNWLGTLAIPFAAVYTQTVVYRQTLTNYQD